MHTVKVILILFSLVYCIVGKTLLIVKDLGEQRRNYPIIEVIGGYNILHMSKEEINNLSSRGMEYKILDETTEGKSYYLVRPFYHNPDDIIVYSTNILNQYGRVLATFDEWVLMEGNDEVLHSMKEYRLKLDYVELEPMEFFPKNNTIIGKKSTQYNQAIQEMLSRVSPDSVEAFEKKLTSFHTRHVASTTSKEEVIPYMKEIYKQYGCDTVISLPLQSGFSDEVIGIRYGTKDPSVKKFVLLGGHTDNIITGVNVNTQHQGGNDNATGQVAVLEACRVHQYYEFDYTIIYCTFNGEERGLHGSNAVCKFLKQQGAQTIGGNFSYDMFGMSKSDINFRVFDKNTGAQEFVTKMKELKDLYELSQPVGITLTNSSSIPSDPRNLWNNGFTSIGHNFAMGGSGRIHTADDKMMPSYDKVFQAECAKLGLITTAEYAGVHPVSIKKNTISTQRNMLTINQKGNSLFFTLNKSNTVSEGVISIYSLQGKLLKKISVNSSQEAVKWDKTNHNGTMIQPNSIVLLQYKSSSSVDVAKVVLK